MVLVRRTGAPRSHETPARLAADAQRRLDFLTALGSTTFRRRLGHRASALDLTFAPSPVLVSVAAAEI